MQHTQEDFLAAVLADPADRHVRLVFADWLDERDRERDRYWAALIRAQSTGGRDVTVYVDYGSAIYEIPETARDIGIDPVALVRGVRAATAGGPLVDAAYWYRRVWIQGGFVTGINTDMAPFLEQTGALFATYPLTTVICMDRHYDGRVAACGFGYMPNDHWIADTPSHTVPRAIWDDIQEERNCREAADPTDYETWLRGGCVRYGRRKAGLGPLPGTRTIKGTS